MGKNRLYRTLEYSARVMRLYADYRWELGAQLVNVQGRTWLDYTANFIKLIGDYLDPTTGPRGRLWWLSIFVVYGLVSGTLVSEGTWNFGQLLLGVAWLLIGFIGCGLIGMLQYLKQRSGHTRLT